MSKEDYNNTSHLGTFSCMWTCTE